MKLPVEIVNVVITGGPCAGKSSVLSYLMRHIESRGIPVLVVPEAATFLKKSGIDPKKWGMTVAEFQRRILVQTIAWHDERIEVAKGFNYPKVVILSDRGVYDSKAYMDDDSFRNLLAEFDLDPVHVRDIRYQAVIHLVTAANGAEEFYTTENNDAREETPEEARILDLKTQQAWNGAQHITIIPNVDSKGKVTFEQKKKRTLDALCRILGLPVPLEIERKFLIKGMNLEKMPPHQVVDIEQFYLPRVGETRPRFRKRGQFDSWVYFETMKRKGPGKARIETEHIVDAHTYFRSLSGRDPERGVVKKRRHCFIANGHYFELDQFVNPRPGQLLLEVELAHEDDEVLIPDFLEVEREVTDEKEFGNETIAKEAA